MIDLYNKLQIINHNIYEENTKYLEFVMTTKPFIILWSEVDYFTDDDYMRLNKLNTIYSYYSESLYECERDYELILNTLSANIRKEKLKRILS